MSKKNNNQLVNEYIQFSKKITRWGVILVSIMLLICLLMITTLKLDLSIVQIISQLYTTYVTIIGITIGAYQGNSSLEKWSKARYSFKETFTSINEEEKQEQEQTNIEEQG